MSATFASVGDLRDAVTGRAPSKYRERMYQEIPDLPTVKNRMAYLVEKAKGQRVLDIGCTGEISKAIREVASEYHGVDKTEGNWTTIDLDHRPDHIPVFDVDLIICSEVLEHLGNPGYFLLALKSLYPGKTVYITVPNAGAYVVKDNCEVVNADHVCWYSYSTLKTLLTRYGYQIEAMRWYNGEPYNAEGLIAVVRT